MHYTDVADDYYSTDFVAVGGGANVRHLQFWKGLMSGGAIIVPYCPEGLISSGLMPYSRHVTLTTPPWAGLPSHLLRPTYALDLTTLPSPVPNTSRKPQLKPKI